MMMMLKMMKMLMMMIPCLTLALLQDLADLDLVVSPPHWPTLPLRPARPGRSIADLNFRPGSLDHKLEKLPVVSGGGGTHITRPAIRTTLSWSSCLQPHQMKAIRCFIRQILLQLCCCTAAPILGTPCNPLAIICDVSKSQWGAKCLGNTTAGALEVTKPQREAGMTNRGGCIKSMLRIYSFTQHTTSASALGPR